jgi:hypothetical protein
VRGFDRFGTRFIGWGPEGDGRHGTSMAGGEWSLETFSYREDEEGWHQLIEGKGGRARTTSISVRGRWLETPTTSAHGRPHGSNDVGSVRLKEGGRKVCGPLLGPNAEWAGCFAVN